MLQVCSKITSVLLLFLIIQIECCTRENFNYIKITVKPKPLGATQKDASSFFIIGDRPSPRLLLLAVEGSTCRANIQKYEEEAVKHALSVDVRNHFIPILYHGDVQNLEHLESIYLEENSIQELQPRAFLNVPKIKIISLINNSIEEIQEGVFNNLKVEKINLHNNKISQIAPGAFDNMPNLLEIDLSNNLLTYWNDNWLKYSPKIKTITANFNELIKIPQGAFSNIKYSLEELELSNNKIDVIDAVTIGELQKLRKLSLENNKFNCISDDVLKAFPEHLILSIAPNDNLTCLCWNKLQKWSFKYYKENKDTIFFTVRHAEIQCNNEIVEMLHDTLSRVSVLEKHLVLIRTV